ncbi:metal-dependent hydrolase family protein [Glutamicibacter arilaitensis]|uniref:Amidohydrolase family protein n=1 Tax=Glutamicibacter arilaitensis TaxID=256701 RepID=A0A4Y8TSU6_9MICC|nr:amidohydrolase family protein [Glutamicibacter arilaitensis]TFH54443.1 amidohydrolase family protein [Glutamicibacter arilaitensis]
MSTVIRPEKVFDGETFLPSGTEVLIDGGQIREVGPGLVADDIVELPNCTLTPGLIDCHVHLTIDGINPLAQLTEPFSLQFYTAADTLRRTLDLGITTVRDAAGADAGIKRAIELGLVEGPDMRIAVNILSQTGGHSDGVTPSGAVHHLLPEHPGRPGPVVDGVEEMRKRVRELQRAGADVVKICTSGGVSSVTDNPHHAQFSMDELEACVREAKSGQTPVMAHAQGKQGIINAIRAGVRSIEHGVYADDECFQLMIEHNVWLVPTLLAPVALNRMIDAGASVADEVARKSREAGIAHAAMIKQAVKAGVKIAMGTDAGLFKHGINLEELQLMQRAGMSPEAVLHASTQSAAQLLGFDDRGAIRPGLRADLAVFRGDLTSFEGLSSRVAGVYKSGRKVR